MLAPSRTLLLAEPTVQVVPGGYGRCQLFCRTSRWSLSRILLASILLSTLATSVTRGQMKDPAQYANTLFKRFEQERDQRRYDEALRTANELVRVYGRELGEKHRNVATMLFNAGDILSRQDKYAESMSYYERSLAIAQELKNADLMADASYGLGEALVFLNKFSSAQAHLERALRIRESLPQKQDHEIAVIRNCLGLLFSRQGKTELARDHYEKALAINRRLYGENHRETQTVRNNIANLSLREENDPGVLQNTLSNEERQNGPDTVRAAELSGRLGMMLLQKGQYQKSRSFLERAYQGFQKNLGETNARTTAAMVDLGLLQEKLGEPEAAKRTYHQALEIQKRTGRENQDLTITILTNLGTASAATENYPQAKQFLLEALERQRQSHPNDDAQTATILSNLGTLHSKTADYSAASEYQEQALSIRKKQLAPQHPDIARSLGNAGVLQAKMGNMERARAKLEEAIGMLKRPGGPVHPDVTRFESSLAMVNARLGDDERAIAELKKNLNNQIESLGPNSAEVARIRANLGMLLDKVNRDDEALEQLKEAVRISEQVNGLSHTETARARNNLAALLLSMGSPQALPQSRDILTTVKARLGENHPSTILCMDNVAAIEATAGNWQEAGKWTDTSQPIRQRLLYRFLAAMTEDEQHHLLSASRDSLEGSLSLGLSAPRDMLAARSAEWAINGKGIGHAALAQQALALREGTTRERAKTVQELLAARRALAELFMSAPPEGQADALRERFKKLDQEEKRLAHALARPGGADDELSGPNWASLDKIRSRIPGDGCLVEFVAFRPRRFEPQSISVESEHYCAWVIPPAGRGDVRVVDLGESAPIKALITEIRGKIDADGRLGGPEVLNKKTDSIDALDAKLVSLTKLIYAPLFQRSGPPAQLLLSPDGDLWLVPWAALPIDGSLLIERSSIRYLISGRDLIDDKRAAGALSAPVIFADPDFDATEQLGEKAEAKSANLSRVKTDAFASLSQIRGRLSRVERLPGTKKEAEKIEPHLARLSKSTPRVYLGSTARESIVRSLSRPSSLVFSTHGFSLPIPETAAAETSSVANRRGNPLLRCGLLLAGCNRAQAETRSSDDGVLTGLEVVGLDLRGTELVVMSACETGIGTVQNGEGVAGLRQAFQLAGAQTVVSTLWSIPDAETATLMSDYFDNVAAGKSNAEALRAAQRKMIDEHRGQYHSAHPFFWAGFTVTGK